MIGQIFVRLEVVGQRVRKQGRWHRECRCVCGEHRLVLEKNLRNGNTKSCGCLRRDRSSRMMVEMHTTHGLSQRSEYRIWAGIKTRCFNEKDPGYPRYGGRGISMCREWVDSFEAFYEYVGPRPTEAHTIERDDNDGDYEPGNARWATAKEQANNRRSSRFIEYLGERKTVSQWAEILGWKTSTFEMRLKRGWTIEEAASLPLHSRVVS